MRKIKEIKNSKISVRRIIEGTQRTDEDGHVYVDTRWEEINKPINFGSLAKKQNEDVIEIKFEIPSDKKPKNPFENLFKS